MEMLLPLTPEQLARAEKHLLNPPPGSRTEAARLYGIDLTLLIRQLRLTPEERIKRLDSVAIAVAQIHGLGGRHK